MGARLIFPWGEGGDAWDRLKFAGVLFTGTVEVSGTPWKKKHSRRSPRGRNGGRTVAHGWDLGAWTITLTSTNDEEDAQLAALIEAVTTSAPSSQDARALPIEHPALAVKGVSQVLFEEGDVPEPDPGGTMTWTFKVTEYRPPLPRDVTRSPAPARQGPDQGSGGDAPDGNGYGADYVPQPPPAPTADP